MDGNGGMNFRNWGGGYYEPMPAFKGQLGLQLMPTEAEKPFMGGRISQPAVMVSASGGAYRISGGPDTPVTQNYLRDTWFHPGDRYGNLLPRNHHPNFTMFQENTRAIPENSRAIPENSRVLSENTRALPETTRVLLENPRTHPSQILQQANSSNDERVVKLEENGFELEGSSHPKKRPASKIQKSPKTKKAKRAPRAPKDEYSPPIQRARVPKKSAEVVINGIDMDISGIPIPVCSCTGTPQQCYRWGSGGWQSACCTTGMSMYPLPTSTKRRGARIAGRKMSLGAFKKVLEKLASEGYNFSNAIDLRTHWARHGTNKFVTIK